MVPKPLQNRSWRGSGGHLGATLETRCFQDIIFDESVRVPRFPGDTRDALWSPVARSAVDASRCCTWQRAHRAGPIGRALSGPPWGPLGGPFGPALGRALRAPVQQQDTYFLFFIIKRRRGKAIGRFWALLPKWLSGYLWRFILSISGPCCPNGSQEASGSSF